MEFVRIVPHNAAAEYLFYQVAEWTMKQKDSDEAQNLRDARLHAQKYMDLKGVQERLEAPSAKTLLSFQHRAKRLWRALPA